jgi:hypothetical protein
MYAAASAQSSAEHIQELERFRDEAFTQFALLTVKQMADLPPEDQHETYKYLDLCLDVNGVGEVRISGAVYPDGSYFDPTGSAYGVETGVASVGVVESSSLYPFATRGGCERIRRTR